MKIELTINGEQKVFEAGNIPGRVFKDVLKLQEKLKGEMTPDVLDELIAFICKVFGDQFTVEQYWDGIPLQNVLTEIVKVMNEIHRMVLEAAQ